MYAYKPLEQEEIRTLTILPGAHKDSLCGVLEQHQLGDPTKPYQALSYVWGSPRRREVLYLGEHRVHITRNADALLRHLRDPYVGRRVWIDGICINQRDLTERCHQLPMMHAIYTGAENVLIWAGNSDQHTRSVVDFFNDLKARHLNTKQERQKLINDTSSLVFSVQLQSIGESTSITEHERDSFARIRAFVDRPWFHRAWTFQEACLSTRCQLLCGEYSLPWSTVVSATLYLSTRGMVSAVFGSSADILVALAHFSAANSSRHTPYLSILLPLTRRLEATDDRDKVYALLGLADRTGLPPLQPSYTQSTSEAYSAAAKAMIAQEGGLSILSGVHCARPSKGAIPLLTRILSSSTQYGEKMPSWVPDWRLPRRAAYLHGFDWPSTEHLYHINRGAPFRNLVPPNLGRDSAVLPMRGARIDTIVGITSPDAFLSHFAKYPVSSPGENPATSDAWQTGLQKLLLRFCAKFSLPLTYDQTGCDMSECLLRTITADRGGVGKDAVGVYRMSMEIGKFSTLRPVCFRNNILDDETGTETDRAMKALVMAAWTFLHGRKIIRTKRGLVGIVGEDVRVGDEVWNLVGGEVPFVLAAAENGPKDTTQTLCGKGSKKMMMVGEAYVDGVMKGGLWQAEKSVWQPKKESSKTSPARVDGYELEFEDLELV